MSKSSKSIVNSQDLNSLPHNSGLAVSTDQLDYAPGSTAYITLTGLATGGRATFQIADLASDPGDDGDADVYKSFTATDGGRGDLDGIANGTIVTKWTVPKNGDANNATLSLTATTTNGATATTTFTDAAGSISKVYQHWADEGSRPEWNNNILSANKSDYFEGEVIPHVFVYKASNKVPLVNGQVYSFTITYNYYQANTNAGGFAVITDFNESRTPGSLPGASPGQEPLIDGTFANGGGIDGSFHTVDANITNVSGVTFTGTSTKSANVTVTFTYSGPTTKSGIAEIYYGLQIATPGQVPNQGAGPTEGASAWTGGSLQTTVSVGGSGATSIQLSPAAILAGEISGVKFNDLDGDGIRDAGEPGLSGWTIFLDKDDDGDLDAGEVSTTTGADGSYTFSVTPDADKTDTDNDPYVVREVNQNGWTQTSDDPADILISAADPTEANVNFGNQQQAPSLNIIKTADPDQTADAAGELITYTLTVENTGNQTLTNVTVTDPFADDGSIARGADIVGDDDDLLEVGETWSYTAAHTVTQAEIDSNGGEDGFLENTATADSDESDEDTDDATVPVDQNPSLNIVKEADPDQTADAADELITYTLTVENTGNQTLSNVTVTDPFADDGSIARGADIVGDDDDLLEVGETWSYTAAHTVTQAEIDSNGGDDGFLENTATADSDESDEDTDDATVPVDQNPSLNIVKEADPDQTADAAGELITYTLTVENTGNQTLANVTVTDPFADDGSIARGADIVGDDDDLLEVGETWSYTAAHTVTQDEIDSNGGEDGFLENTATADSDESDEDTDDATVPVDQNPSLNIVKEADPDQTADAAGELITYTLTVENTGNQTLSNVTVTDPFADDGSIARGADIVGDDDDLLEVGETWSYTAAHTVTQAEIDSNGDGDGFLENTATADSDESDEDTDDATVPVGQGASLNIIKEADPDQTADAAGELITYTLTVENTGNQTLSNVTVTDPFADDGSIARGADVVGDDDDLLEVGETWSYTAAHTVTQAEIDSNGGEDGFLENTATADSDESDEDTDDATVPVDQNPSLNIVKEADPDQTADAAGELITYTLTVENTGNQTLANVTVTDPFADDGSIARGADVVGDDDDLLEVGETWSYTAAHTVTQAEIDSNGGDDGFLENTATADSDESDEDTDDATVPVDQNPSLNIVKEADPDQTADAAGELITYTLTVENTGNQTLANVTVTDPFADDGSIARGADIVGDDDDLLEVGETWSYTAAHTVTQAEIDSNGGDDGFLENTATADSDESDEDTDDATVPVDQNPSLNIVKEADPDQTADAADELITYTLTVENTGNQTLSNVTVTDPFADDGSIARGADIVGDDDDLLEVGETWSYTAAHTVTQAEIDSNGGDDGFLENTATADSDESDEDTDDATVPVDQNPGILLEKTGTFNDENEDGDADVGETIGYTFVVTNTGNVTLTNVTVTDPLVTVVGGPTTLDVDETDSTTFTGTYVLTQADIDAGQVDNTALATGTPAVGDDTTDDDDDTVPLPDDEPVVDALDISVDEDFLAAGNEDQPSESPGDDDGTASATGEFPIDLGSDFAGATISFAALSGEAVEDTLGTAVMTSDGDLPLTYFWDAANNRLYGSTDPTNATTAAATAAFTLEVSNPDGGSQSGGYIFTLHEALEHAQGDTPNTEDPNIVLSLDYLVTDSDLDEATGTLGITIDDDMPIRAADATPIAATVEEDGMSTAVADPEGLNGPDQSDGNPAAGDSTDDDQKSSLIAGSLAALVAVGADAPAAFGLDDDTSSLPDLFSKGEAVSYATSDSDLDGILDTLVATADGRTIFTLKVNTDGTWEFDLDDQLDHVDDAGNGENVDLRTALDGSTSISAIDFSGIIAVTDADGDTANVLLAGDFTIAVEDDIPELTDADNLSIVNALGSESGAATFSVGADEPVSFVITDATGVEGVDYTISGDGKTVTGLADLDGDGDVDDNLYTFTIDDAGAYTFELLAELPPPDPVPFTAAGIASGAYDQLTLTNSGLQLVIDALAATGADTDLQVSQASGGGLAVVNNNIEDEEAVTFSFETTSGDEVAASAFTLTIKADAGNPNYVWTATLEDGTVVTLDDGGVNNPGGADVTYAPLGSGDFTATVELASGELFTDLKLQVVGNQNDKAKLGLQGFSFTPDTQDVDLAFDIQATDADGDTATLQLADYDNDTDLDSLLVHIEADGVTDLLADAAMQTYLQSLSTSV